MLLEDDENLNRGIALKLQKEGYQVFSAFQISEAEKLFDENRIDLVISDITLPDGNGLEFCRKIRNKSKVFVLFLTAMDSEIDPDYLQYLLCVYDTKSTGIWKIKSHRLHQKTDSADGIP